ncbi:ORF6N domain-containing protein [Candidatus Desantisbacteria bacterium]|nr:ORF6N domain-containing protein [Candidatus Desantisbacteria bacterium]
MKQLVPIERIESRILIIREQKVMLDRDLADLYEVITGNLNKAVKRNIERFPDDFMFQLTKEEFDDLRFHFGISKTEGRGGRKYLPYAFTEQGVAMLSSVLNSKRAILVNIQIMRVFTQLKKMLASNDDLKRKIEAMESKYDAQFKVVFDAIKSLMSPPTKEQKKIGFRKEED